MFDEKLYNKLPCGYHSLDKNGVFIQINDTELQMLGYRREEVLGRKFSELITPESLVTFEQNFPILKQQGWVKDLEFQMCCKHGTILPVSLSARAVKDAVGNYLMSHSIVIDIRNRQKKEAAIRDSEQRFQNLADNAPVMVWVTDPTGYCTYVNQSWYDFSGQPEEEGLGFGWLDGVHPDDQEQAKKIFLDANEHQEQFQIEYRFRRYDGEYRWVIDAAKPWRGIDGQFKGYIGSVIDITERKQAELALQQQVIREHLLREITQAIHQSFDVEKVLQTAVEETRKYLDTERVIIFRFDSDESGTVISESVTSGVNSILNSQISDPCFEERYIEPYRQGRVGMISNLLLSDAEPCYKELMAQFQVKANIVVPILQQQHLWGLLIAHQCSTPRQWLPEEIELLQQLTTQLGIALQQAELYQKNVEQAALIDIASDAIFVRDLSNRILFWSRGAERMYGWTKEEVINRVAQEIFNQEPSSQLETALATTIEQGSWNGQLKQITKDDQEIIVESRWTLMPNAQGNPQSILVVNTDITEKKQLEQQLLHAQRLETIGTLAGGIAHDLNNILTPIVGFSQLLPLHIPNLNDESLQMLNIIRNSALRGAEIVKQVLLFSRDIPSEWELINLKPIFAEIMPLIRETFPKTIIIEDYIAPNLWQVYGDATQLHQVIMNVCLNARDAMPDGGQLVIAAENLLVDEQYSLTNFQITEGNYILISVTDTGIGILPEDKDRIFEPFFTTKQPGKGTGLGLSTVFGIIQNHGGTIEVNSEPDLGTQFKIYLPASKDLASNEILTDDRIYSSQGELILVVDDEVPILKVTKTTLEKHNYRVLTASDGIEAIAIYAQQSQEIQVVLMDLIMPEMDGVTAIRILKKINPQVKIIATSGLTNSENITAAKHLGIETFLVKPYTIETLLFTINDILLAD